MEGIKNFAEDWQLNKKLISERGKYLLENPVWSDCKFMVGTEEPHVREFEAHKLLLSMSSPVFATMFYGGLPEIQMPIKIVDVQPEAFKSMLEYIYTDTITLESLDQACELCYVAKKYMLPHLLRNCMEYIWKDVDDDTALRAYEFAKLFDDAGISEKSMKIISEHTTEILSKPGALTASLATIIDILEVDQLNVASELYLFNVLQSWILFNSPKTDDGKYDTEKLRSLAKPALQKIRFLTMEVADFADGPAQSPLLTKEESFAILLNISSPRSKYPLPDGYSRTRIPRGDPSKKMISLSRKLYVPRAITNSVVQINNGHLMDSFRFVTNDDITLLGAQIPTQIVQVAMNTAAQESSLHVRIAGQNHSDVMAGPSGLNSEPRADKSRYREFLTMYVKEVRNSENSWFTHFTSLVEHNSVMNVMFTTPAVIKQDREYELGVTLSRDGYYLVGSFDRTLEKYSDNVQFVLSGNSDNAFISSLIFAH